MISWKNTSKSIYKNKNSIFCFYKIFQKIEKNNNLNIPLTFSINYSPTYP